MALWFHRARAPGLLAALAGAAGLSGRLAAVPGSAGGREPRPLLPGAQSLHPGPSASPPTPGMEATWSVGTLALALVLAAQRLPAADLILRPARFIFSCFVSLPAPCFCGLTNSHLRGPFPQAPRPGVCKNYNLI